MYSGFFCRSKSLGAFVALLLGSTISAQSDPNRLPYSLSAWACSEATAWKFRDCTTVTKLDFSSIKSEPITIYMEFWWKSEDLSKRGSIPVYFQWLYTDEDDKIIRYSNYSDNSPAYIFSPRSWAQPSKWTVTQTIYQYNKGRYVFSAFSDPSKILETTLWSHEIQVGDS